MKSLESQVPYIEFDQNNLLNKTIIIFGSSNSGKTTLVRDILYRIRHDLDTAFIISGTKNSSGSYDNILPEQFIFKSFNPEWFNKYLERQKQASEIYRLANDMDTLKSLFKKISTSDQKQKVCEMKTVKKRIMNKYKLLFQNDEDKLEKMIEDTKKMYDEKITSYYKQILKKHRSRIPPEHIQSLPENERIAITFCNFNPKSLILFDDCASEFKKWYCENKECFKKLFYEGRWYNITTIVTSQDDKEVDSELRKNSTYIFFTTIQSAICNFSKKANGYSSYTIQKCKELCHPVNFSNHVKMVFIKDSIDQFKFFKAKTRKRFQLGSESIWKLSNMINEKKKNTKNGTHQTNMFLQQTKSFRQKHT